MTREELEKKLTAYTETEKRYIREGPDGTVDTESSKPEELKEGNFLRPGENIGIVRQDRFRPVSTHKHNYIELNYVWSGWCVQTVKGRQIVTRKGDICLMDPQAEHSVGVCGEHDIIVNLLMSKKYFDSGFFSRMSGNGIMSRFLLNAVTKQRNREHFLMFPTSESSRVPGIMEEILLEYYGDDLGRQEVLDSYMIILFTEMLRSFRDVSQTEGSREGISVGEILSYMEKHYRDCTLQETADAFGFHPVYLTTALKEKTGKSFVEHLQSQRINQARRLLLRTDLTVADIAGEVGYSNVEFFYRKFRQAEGCTPKEYRKQHRESPQGA